LGGGKGVKNIGTFDGSADSAHIRKPLPQKKTHIARFDRDKIRFSISIQREQQKSILC